MTRSLRIEKVPATTLVRIVWNGGGEVPAVLSGNYTSALQARFAIESWKAAAGREEVEEESPSMDEEKEKQEARKRGRPAKQL